MSADAERYPPPNEPDAFESLCLDLWKEIWDDPGARKNGRAGQAQAGVDVFGVAEERTMGVPRPACLTVPRRSSDLQHPPGPLAGQLKDPAVTALLKGLAASNPGLCLVTTRESVADLASFRDTTAPEWKLGHLGTAAGVELLKGLGVHGAEDDLVGLVDDVAGHALTLQLLGGFLSRAHGGDVRRRDRVRLREHHPDAWRAAHGRLFEHLRDSTEHQPDTLEGL